MRLLLALVLVLALPATAAAARTVKPDRPAINRLLDEFIPAAVEQKNLQRGWELSAGYARTVTHREWLRGNTSVQKYPAKGTTFHGWTVNYSLPGDLGFDILLQPTNAALGAWSFRGEAQKLHGQWRITTWYPVATFAPPGRTQTVLGPNDLGPGNAAARASVDRGRLGAWVLALPIAVVGGIGLIAVGFVGVRALRQRSRIREIERDLAR
jgi:opacity protein-like surface antigen